MPFSSHFCPSLHKAAVCHFSALNVSVDSSCISETLSSPHHSLGASRALASVCRFTLMTNSCVPYCSSGVLSVCHFLEPSTLIQFLFPVLRIFDFFFFFGGGRRTLSIAGSFFFFLSLGLSSNITSSEGSFPTILYYLSQPSIYFLPIICICLLFVARLL